MTQLITQIGACLTAAIGWIGDVVTAMFGTSGELADLTPFLALAIGVGLVGLGVKYVRSFVKIS